MVVEDERGMRWGIVVPPDLSVEVEEGHREAGTAEVSMQGLNQI